MSKSLKPWILVIIGILFNILSALISHYFIGLNNQRISQLDQQISQLETLITGQWRRKTEIERKQEFLLLLMTQVKQMENPKPVKQLLKHQLDELIKTHNLLTNGFSTENKEIHFDTLISLLTRSKQSIIDSINDSFLEKLELENEQQPLKERNTGLLSLAIFLQITGLILVLARDMKPA